MYSIDMVKKSKIGISADTKNEIETPPSVDTDLEKKSDQDLIKIQSEDEFVNFHKDNFFLKIIRPIWIFVLPIY